MEDSEIRELQRKAAQYDSERHWWKWLTISAVAVIFAVVAVWAAYRLVGPQLNLYKANTEKQAQIAESKAKAEAAVFEAQAEVTRAEGVAEANRVIASSITDEYVRWLYVDQMDRLQGQVIYIPTEGGIPILEAGRSVSQPQSDG